jgi:hypothetical protein
LIASIDTGEALSSIPPGATLRPDEHIVLTFNGLIHDESFVNLMRAVLQRLEEGYLGPVDLEFAILVDVSDPSPAEEGTYAGQPERRYRLYILECRPLNEPRTSDIDVAAEDVKENRRLFTVPTLLQPGNVTGIDYLVFIDPEHYYDIEDEMRRKQIADIITALNDVLPADRFGLIGPGRWGSLNSRLSVPVTYSDICNARLLVEISPPYVPRPELAFGTDFFEEVKEAHIFVLGIQPTAEGGTIDWQFLRESPNSLSDYAPWAAAWSDSVRVIDLRAVVGSPLRIIIDDASQAVAYFDRP